MRQGLARELVEHPSIKASNAGQVNAAVSREPATVLHGLFRCEMMPIDPVLGHTRGIALVADGEHVAWQVMVACLIFAETENAWCLGREGQQASCQQAYLVRQLVPYDSAQNLSR